MKSNDHHVCKTSYFYISLCVAYWNASTLSFLVLEE